MLKEKEYIPESIGVGSSERVSDNKAHPRMGMESSREDYSCLSISCQHIISFQWLSDHIFQGC